MSFKDYFTRKFDIAMAVQEEATAAVDYDLCVNRVSECLFSPATESLSEDMEVLCMEHMHVLAALEEKQQAALEASGNEAVMEGFKETVKKYWERFKAFIIKIKNLVVRTIQRVIGYIKTLIMRITAKVVAKLRGKDAKKMEKEVEQGSRFVKKIEVRPNLSKDVETLCGDYQNFLNKFVDDLEKVGDKNAGSKKEIEDLKDRCEDFFDNNQKNKSELIDEILGEAKDVNVTEISKLEAAYNAIKKAKVPKAVDTIKKNILKAIDRVEKEASKKSKTISSERIALYTYIVNHSVQQMNAILAAIQETYVLWLSARIKVVNAYYNASEEKEEDEDDDENKSSTKSTTNEEKSAVEKERSKQNVIDDDHDDGYVPGPNGNDIVKQAEAKRKAEFANRMREGRNKKKFARYTDEQDVDPSEAF
ncbi:MAG: hypothetical protein SPF22_08145 [Candidatus Onthovivens sp.]|nr:hypothetical protein [Candidatus Onthovivens sp.]